MCSIALCVLNVCKPQEYPGFLRSYVNRKINVKKRLTVNNTSIMINLQQYLNED